MTTMSLNKDKIKILLLEDLHANAEKYFRNHGYDNLVVLKNALDNEELKKAVADVHMIGIRSRTKLTADVFEAAKKLMAVGCFCIGTNQVDLNAAKAHGIPVFNAPYSNTRSVAELVIGEIVMLMRGIAQRNAAAHEGVWLKNAKGATEVRGKVLGIVGYGHIGTQVSILAEAMGMKVRYFDIVDKLALGNAEPCASLSELLSVSDVVSLHVPQTPQTEQGNADVRVVIKEVIREVDNPRLVQRLQAAEQQVAALRSKKPDVVIQEVIKIECHETIIELILLN